MKLLSLTILLFLSGVASMAQAQRPNNNEVSLLGQEISSNRNFRFFFQTTAGQNYPIEVSLDLINWSPLTNAVGTGESLWVQDDNPPSLQQRFYHVGVHPTPIPNMVFVNPGVFTMGSPASEFSRGTNEGPQTVVTLSRGFWMGKYEVTQDEYSTVTGAGTASFFYGP